MRTPRIRLSVRGVRALCLAVAVWLAVSWAVAHRLTGRRRSPFPEPVPARTAKAYEPARLSTRDGHSLGAWFVDGRADSPSILVLHGNGGSRWNSLGRSEILASAGCAVLLVSLRAHGDSSGGYNDFGYGARYDVVSAVEYLERRRHGRPVIILGASLGAAAALFASAELGGRVRGYILESPYKDLRTAVWNRLDDALPPVLDWVAYRGLVAVSPLVVPHLDRISPHDAAGGIPANVPVLILAGAEDRRARVEEARALLGRLSGRSELVVFPGADHLRMIDIAPARYRDAVLGFVEEVHSRCYR